MAGTATTLSLDVAAAASGPGPRYDTPPAGDCPRPSLGQQRRGIRDAEVLVVLGDQPAVLPTASDSQEYFSSTISRPAAATP